MSDFYDSKVLSSQTYRRLEELQHLRGFGRNDCMEARRNFYVSKVIVSYEASDHFVARSSAFFHKKFQIEWRRKTSKTEDMMSLKAKSLYRVTSVG